MEKKLDKVWLPYDGTMIVVEGGKRYIGNSVDVMVTSVLQSCWENDIRQTKTTGKSPLEY